ncbi:sulfonate ABC transporter substrate-binding protein [Methanosarcinales archaeon ex4484_138]|nr:MAG: sulfonate ABC transporter substrate-binding protein [Methanosarcinales archaeon ex4484_138]
MKRTHTAHILFIAILFIIVAASGCVKTDEGEEITTLSIGYQPSTHQLAHVTAMEKGWWKHDLAPFGIEEVTDKQFPSGPPEMQAMLAGDLDIAYVGSAPPITAIAQGLDAKVVACVNTNGSDLVLRPEIDYTTPEDLKGLTIATFRAGSIQDTVFKKWLIDNNINPDTDLTIKDMGPGDAITAIASKSVDGVFLPHPSPTIIESHGAGRMILQSGEMWQSHSCCVLVVSGKLIRERPELVEQIIKTHINATAYNLAHPEDAARLAAEKLTMNESLLSESLNTWDGTWCTDPRGTIPSTLEYANVQYKLGYIEKPLTEEDLFDTSFYEKITEER